MKRVLDARRLGISLVIMLMLSGVAWAQTYVRPTQSTVAWDAVVETGQTVSYKVYVAPLDDKDAKTFLGTTTELTYTVTIPTELSMYVVGVSTIVDEGGAEEKESAINWSDVNGANTPQPFIYVNLNPPTGLKTLIE
jgi:hypothetical protein